MSHLLQRLAQRLSQSLWRERRFSFTRVSDQGPQLPVSDAAWAGPLAGLDDWMRLETGGGAGRCLDQLVTHEDQ